MYFFFIFRNKDDGENVWNVLTTIMYDIVEEKKNGGILFQFQTKRKKKKTDFM